MKFREKLNRLCEQSKKYGLVNDAEVEEYEKIMKLIKGTPVKVKLVPGTSNVVITGHGTKVAKQLGMGGALEVVDAKIKVWKRDR